MNNIVNFSIRRCCIICKWLFQLKQESVKHKKVAPKKGPLALKKGAIHKSRVKKFLKPAMFGLLADSFSFVYTRLKARG